MTSKSTTLLLQDHKRLLQVLNVLDHMAASAKRGQTLDETHVKDVLEFLQDFGDAHHQGKEEAVLFPALLYGPNQKNYRELCALIFEHNRQRSLIEGLQDSAITGKTEKFIFYATRLTGILRTHMQQEEDILFPLVEATLSPAEDDRVVTAMKAYDRQWQDRELLRLLGKLDRLEAEYLRKDRAQTA
jgi:hemerythrin-like domain-containing protein